MYKKPNSASTGFASLIPMPAEMTVEEGKIALDDLTAIHYSHSSLAFSAQYLSNTLQRHGLPVVSLQKLTKDTTQTNSEPITIRLVLQKNSDKESGYQLLISDTDVDIIGDSSEGVFHGVQTLVQLVELATLNSLDRSPALPRLTIKDHARCQYRGLHLDVSRHFRPVEDIKQLLDLMAEYKMNHFHWHLVDDQGWRIEIKQYPKLTQVGGQRDGTVQGHSVDRGADIDGITHSGYYTQEQIKDIVAYAQERFITIIPEIDLPGHSSALLAAYPEHACKNIPQPAKVQRHFGIFNHVLCNRDETFHFLSDVLTEIAQLFPANTIHLGGDEVRKLHWESCPDCQHVLQQQGLSDSDQLHGYFIRRVVDILSSLNKQAICWDDVLSAKNLPSSVTIMSWLGKEHADEALARGHPVIMTQTNLYFDFYQSMSIDEPFAIHGHAPIRKVYEYDPLQHHNRVLGAQANIWTEYIKSKEQLEYALLPRLLALAEVLWTPHKLQNWTDFKARLQQHFPRFDQYGLNASRSIFVPEFDVSQNSDGSYQVAIVREYPDLAIHYTLDHTRPGQDSSRYRSPLTVREPTVIHACCMDTNGHCFNVNRISVFPHLALNCEVTLYDAMGAELTVEQPELLTNGLPQQGQRFQHNNWVPVDDSTMIDVHVDLKTPQPVESVSLGFDGALGRKLYYPDRIEILTSGDAEQWTHHGSYKHDATSGRSRAQFERSVARFIRVRIHNPDSVYSHEHEAMITQPLFIDEVIVT